MKIPQKLFERFLSFIGFLLFLGALFVLYHELKSYRSQDLLQHLSDIPTGCLAAACLLTALNYLTLTGYEWLGLKSIRKPLSYRKIVFGSFVATALGNSMGAAAVSGAAIRYRLYSSWGLSAFDVTRIILFYSVTFMLGLFLMSGIAFLAAPVTIPDGLNIPFHSLKPIAFVCLAVMAFYLGLCLTVRKPLKIKAWEFCFPSPKIALAQITLSFLDWALAAAVLASLIPSFGSGHFPEVVAVFMLAQMAGLISQVPGGLGVFEVVVLTSLSPKVPADSLFVSILVYRLTYYLIPLAIATASLGIHEIRTGHRHFKETFSRIGDGFSYLAPNLLAFSAFIAGAVLLFSGVTPAVDTRLFFLRDIIPLPILEASHFLGSLAGVGLLFLARGLQRRLDAAYAVTIGLLVAGIVFSLLKGFDYEEALILSLMLAAFVPCRHYFYRKASLVRERFTFGWNLSIITILLAAVWLGFFAYKHVDYSDELWWRFSFDANAPRFMRALVGILGVSSILAMMQLMRAAPAPAAHVTLQEFEEVRKIVEGSKSTVANLALLGDKNFLFSDTRKAFIMYGVQGNSFISLGDPVGPEDEWPKLVWKFRSLADLHDGRTVFSEIGSGSLPLYLDLGLSLVKLGEDALVPLSDFGLEGNQRKEFRQNLRRIEKGGASFEVIPREAIPGLLPEFKIISDAWLKQKNTKEKGFSLGSFNETYLSFFPAGVVRQNGKIVAFTNMWLGAEKEELSIDLMRYLPEAAPHGVMDYLFTHLMLWGKTQGYRWFNLGMAPLSGLENREFAPLWNRLCGLIFSHGEHFYNFQGLRNYKDKYNPVWKPKYIAAPGGLALPRVLTDIGAISSGGLKGMFSK